MKKKVGVVSLGCPKNLVDSEIMLGLLKTENYEITDSKENAEILIVNTCGFIESAKKESIDTILELASCKKDKCRLLIVTGCLAERYKEQILQEMPEVDAVIGTGNYKEIAEVIAKAFEGNKPVCYGKLDEVDYLESERVLSTPKGFAYLKIAEGCNNCCSYCIIPKLRGRYRSRKIEDIVKEASVLAERGAKELILIAQDTTRYGTDIYNERKLVELIKELSRIKDVEWIRLLYCYPDDIDDRLIEEIASNEKVCKYLDIPIQHASDRILKMMGRRGGSIDVEKLLAKLRDRIPGVVLRTSLIVGFPGENEDDFDTLKSFVSRMKFDRLGVFMYSREEDTPAAKFKSQVAKKIKEKRFNELMSVQNRISLELNLERLNKSYKVMVEGISEDGIFYYGRTYAEAPDIDGLVYFTSNEPLELGTFKMIKILNNDNYDLVGEVVYESAK